MSFKVTSGWNEKTELQAYKIFRILLDKKFPRGLQSKLCKELAQEIKLLSSGNISAKVCNYKSVAGINNSSNSSSDTKKNYEKYKNLSIIELDLIIKNFH
ncbi:hypothetical protein L5F43_07005 [Aliarcobacter butzleri]|uniref:hypothetical protein n=1 Tax=Aliarcobacter butzleri TaxID=28197 RepID=UPI001EDB6BF9|nr:hypothetical protein [Aliarcobacter butzleri]MCG3706240.1 hypothetical protein [Aliarcobacter butzleri]